MNLLHLLYFTIYLSPRNTQYIEFLDPYFHHDRQLSWAVVKTLVDCA